MTAPGALSPIPSPDPRLRVRIGEIWIDAVTFAQAIDRIEELVLSGEGGGIFTPNVDHVVNAGADRGLREAYASARLSLVDGQALLWASRLLGTGLPEKISGSDLLLPLVERAAQRGWSVYLLGGAPGVAARAGQELHRRCGVTIAGVDSPRIGLAGSPEEDQALARVREARPQLVLVALGSPKQELFIQRAGAALKPAVAAGIGASLDFVAGTARRSPRWVSQAGLEWLFRLAQEPRRLARRYLINDPKFLVTLVRMMMIPRAQRQRGLHAPEGALGREVR